MNRVLGIFAAAAFCASFSFGASAQDTPTIKTVLATVDGTDITVGHVIALRGRLPEQYQSLPDDVLFNGIIEQLIQQTVLMNSIKGQMNERLALSLENEKRAFLSADVLSRLSERDVSEEELQTAYAERYDAVVPDAEYDASHILVATEAEALELVAILQDGADFAELAKEKSTGPSGPSGGALGWFGAGMMVAPFEEAVVALAVGEISAPVQTQFGWHVIRLNDMRNQTVPTLKDVRANLVMELQQAAVEAEIETLVGAAEVTRTEIEIDPSIIRDASLFENE